MTHGGTQWAYSDRKPAMWRLFQRVAVKLPDRWEYQLPSNELRLPDRGTELRVMTGVIGLVKLPDEIDHLVVSVALALRLLTADDDLSGLAAQFRGGHVVERIMEIHTTLKISGKEFRVVIPIHDPSSCFLVRNQDGEILSYY